MKESIVFLAAALASVLQIGGASPRASGADVQAEIVAGAVISVEGYLVVLQTDSGVQRRFETSETTLMPTASLGIGDRVSVKYVRGSVPAEILELAVLWQAPLGTSLDSGDHPDMGAFPDHDSGTTRPREPRD